MNDSQFLIVAYHAGGAYAAEADRLKRSLERLGLPHAICPLPDLGDWKANAHLRPTFLKRMRREFPEKALLSVDADCVFHGDPTAVLFGDGIADCDIAFHSFRRRGPEGPSEILPGTLLLRPTPAIDELLERWEQINAARPALADRHNFSWALRLDLRSRSGQALRIAELPAELCWIFDLSAKAYGRRQPIIEHLQASRQFSGGPGIRPATRLARIAGLEAAQT